MQLHESRRFQLNLGHAPEYTFQVCLVGYPQSRGITRTASLLPTRHNFFVRPFAQLDEGFDVHASIRGVSRVHLEAPLRESLRDLSKEGEYVPHLVET